MSNHDSTANDPTATEARFDDDWQLCIPQHIGEAIEQRLSETTFDSVDEYVSFVLESVLREVDRQDQEIIDEAHTLRETDTDGSEAVQNRLESLGYL